MSRRLSRIGALTPLQQGLLTAVLLALALLLGSVLYLVLALPGGWLTPQPRNLLERDIVVARESVDEARAQYGTGATPDGRTPYADAQARLVLARLDAGQVTRARRDGARLFKQFPDNPLVIYARARTLYASESFEDAQGYVSLLFEQNGILDGELLRSLFVLQAQLDEEAGRGADAFSNLMSAARIAPPSASYFEEAGRVALMRERFEDATTAYLHARIYNPDSLAIANVLIGIRNRAPDAYARALDAVVEETGIALERLTP